MAFKNGQDGDIDDTLTRNDYAWRDGAVTTGIIHDRHHDWTVNGGAANQINPGNFDQDWTTSYGFDGLGQLSSATIADGRARAIAFTNDENGQIIRRDESGSIAGQSGNPHEVWYRYGGRQLGYSGNNGTGKVDTQASINERQAAAPGASSSGTFRGGGNVGSRYADFAQSYDPLNSYGQGSGSGAYTASAGETLSSIAQSIWGDANLWYKIAAANGLSGDAQLSEGQQLSLPSGVTRSSFNASSITPYDAGSAIGDTSPTTAKPPKSNKCATMGMLMLAVVAIAVTAIATAGVGSALTGASFSNALGAVTGGALTGFGTATTVLTGFGAAASAATGAAIGAAVSQGLGVATGIQSKFSFKGVALAALSAGLGQGVVGGVSAFGGTSTAANIGNAAVRGVVGSALSQGIGVATGLQSKFSFAGVAAAGVAAGVGAALGGRLPSLNDNGSAGNIASHLAVGGARLIASAATRSALEGSSFGRNITAGLPDVLAQTLVDSAVGAARRGGGSVRERADGGGASTGGGVNMGALESAVARATAGWEETLGLENISLELPTAIAAELVATEAHNQVRAQIRSARLQREQLELQNGDGDIVVTGRPSSQRRRPTVQIIPEFRDISAYRSSPAATFDMFWNREFQSANLGDYFRQHGRIGSALHNERFAEDLIENTSYWQLRQLALPALRTASEGTAELRTVVARLDSHFEGVDSVARNALDRPLGYFVAGGVVTASTGSAGTILLAEIGLTGGVGGAAAGATVDGLSGATGNILFREGMGAENSARTFATDFAVGGAISALFRGGSLALEVREASRLRALTATETSRLTRQSITDYLSGISTRTHGQIADDLQSMGLRLRGSSPDGRFMSFSDQAGRVRAELHPPDPVTTYPHLHIYDRSGSSLDASLNRVGRRSPHGHIPTGGY